MSKGQVWMYVFSGRCILFKGTNTSAENKEGEAKLIPGAFKS